MTINLTDREKPKFFVETKSIGRIGVLPMTTRMQLVEDIGESATDFMRALVTTLGRKADGSHISREEVAELTDDELDKLAVKFLAENEYLVRERGTQRKYRGNETAHLQEGETEAAKRKGESDCQFISRSFRGYRAERKEEIRKILEPFEDAFEAHGKMFPPAFMHAFTTNQLATAQLQKMIERQRQDVSPPIRDLKLPQNPVHDTNEMLPNVVDRLDSMRALMLQMGETVRTLSQSASEFLVAFGAASDKADRSSRRAILIAMCAVGVTLAQIGYSEWRSRQDQAAATITIEEIQDRIASVAAAERKNAELLLGDAQEGNKAIVSSLERILLAIDGLAASMPSRAEDLPSPAER